MGHAIVDCGVADSAEKWVLGHIDRGFLDHAAEIFASLLDPEALEECGFFDYRESTPEEVHGAFIIDQEMAALHGGITVALATKRLVRTAYFFAGWPHRLYNILLEHPMPTQTVIELMDDFDAWTIGKGEEAPNKHLQTLLRRSVFNLVVNTQWVAAFRQSKLEPTADTRELARERIRGIHMSVGCETQFNVMKNNKQMRGKLKVSQLARCMGVVSASRILQTKHKLAVATSKTAVGKDTPFVTDGTFGRGVLKPSIDLKGVASTRQTAEYYSPKPENAGCPAADLPLMQHGCVQGWHTLEGVCCGAVAKSTHRLLARRRDDGPRFDWHMLLHHFKDSTVLAWPVELVPAPYYDDAFYVRFARDVKRFVFLTMLTWEKVEAVCFTWYSVSGMAYAFPRACNDLPPATRAVVAAQPQPLAELAARKAFWTMDLISLRDNARFMKTGIKTSDTMLHTLIAPVRCILKCSEAEALDIAPQRLVTLDESVGELDELMEIGEAVDCLDAGDVKSVKQTQESTQIGAWSTCLSATP